MNCSPRLEEWLRRHPVFGPYIADWLAHRVVPVGASRRQLERQMDAIRRLVDEQEESALLGWEPQYLEAVS